MKYEDAKLTCHVRSAIYRRSKAKLLYWKNNAIPLDTRISAEDKAANDWEEYDPRDEDESSLFMFND